MKRVYTFLLAVILLGLTACGNSTATPSRFTAWGKSVDEISKTVSNKQSTKKDAVAELINNYCYDGVDAEVLYEFDTDGLLNKTNVLIDIDESKCDSDIWKKYVNLIIKEYGDPVNESSIGTSSQKYSWKSESTNIDFMYIKIAEGTNGDFDNIREKRQLAATERSQRAKNCSVLKYVFWLGVSKDSPNLFYAFTCIGKTNNLYRQEY